MWVSSCDPSPIIAGGDSQGQRSLESCSALPEADTCVCLVEQPPWLWGRGWPAHFCQPASCSWLGDQCLDLGSAHSQEINPALKTQSFFLWETVGEKEDSRLKPLFHTVSDFSEFQWHWLWWVEPLKRSLQVLPDRLYRVGFAICHRNRGRGSGMTWDAHEYILQWKTLESNMARPAERKHPIQHGGTTAPGVLASAAINRAWQTWQGLFKVFS